MATERSRGREARKTVTVVFTDVAESTRLGGRLDPESLRRVMSRYFETASRALERHGGSVEKFIGDAVMAVFGVPAVHEDDALRAIRAVAELHEAVEALNADLEREQGVRIALRSGVNTGEVVAGDAGAGQMLVTGDAVNVAARLEQAAAPGEILLGEATRRLVSEGVRVEDMGSLALKGKEDGVRSWRLLEVVEAPRVFARRLDSPLIGRERELDQLRQAFDRAIEERSPYLFTVLGTAGIGKSRLAVEFGSAVSDRARVLTGRCLPYGDGITFWPLAEIVAELVGSGGEIRAAIARHVEDEEAGRVAEGIAALLGRSEGSVAAEESLWAVRKLFEGLADDRPLVVTFEDIHWAEPTFLDLVDHLADWSRDAPVFFLCLARPDLLEKRPTWAGGKLNATSMLLRPLSERESNKLIDHLAGTGEVTLATRVRIADAADGNPLFLEQMLALLEEEPRSDRDVDVPPTIQALLAARLDRLGEEERATLERAAIVGKRFWAGAVAYLSAEEERGGVAPTLQLLGRKELIRPDSSTVPGEEGYRFRHQLIRDAAYGGIPKEVRAELHERFVGWIEERAGERIAEVEEIVGYHLETAFRYRRELAPVDEHGQELAARASERLAVAGRRALARGDASAAASLLERAASLLPGPAPGSESLLVELGSALVVTGQFARADAALADAIRVASAGGNRRVELHGLLERAFLHALTDPAGSSDDLRREAERAIPALEELGDDLGLAKAWRRLADVHWLTNRWDEQEHALERAIEHAERAGDEREAAGARMRLPMALYYGATPVPDASVRAEEIVERGERARMVRSTALVCLGGLRAMTGRFDEARELISGGRAIAEELGLRVWLGGFSLVASDVEMLAGDPAAAEEELRRGYALLESIGERGLLARVAAGLARALLELGQDEEARRLTEVSEGLASADIASQISWRAVRGRILAARGQLDAGEALVREAGELARSTDDVNREGRILLDLATVLALGDRSGEAFAVVERALGCFERKGNSVSATRARAFRDGLERRSAETPARTGS
ncbi:MAG: AAA family ATPase [Actinomycetota bacterium]|nr:AAA family ATPase [Actinomycetota bacterium]